MKPTALAILAPLLLSAACAAHCPGLERSSAAVAPAEAGYPELVLRQGELEVLLYLPDKERGHYRGPRFDWSGVVGSLRVGEHQFIGPWQAKHEPTVHDAATGPVGEFGMTEALGYSEAKPGEGFIKIGVGELRRTGPEPYSFNGEYPIERALPWEVEPREGSVVFRQVLQDFRGFGYAYTKTLSLEANPPSLVLEQELTNTGRRPISTNHYTHNFFRFDQQLVTPAYGLRFSFEPGVELEDTRFGRLTKDGLEVLKAVPARTAIFGSFTPAGTEAGFWFELSHAQLGTSVRVSGDFELEKFEVFALREVLCPEPFLRIELPPGAKKAWSTRYEFSVPPPEVDE
jgi:hypothetical protein